MKVGYVRRFGGKEEPTREGKAGIGKDGVLRVRRLREDEKTRGGRDTLVWEKAYISNGYKRKRIHTKTNMDGILC